MNIEITLPDKSVRTYEKAITGEEVAFDIGPKLGKDAVAIEINRELYDTSYVCLLSTSPSPRDVEESRMPSSA